MAITLDVTEHAGFPVLAIGGELNGQDDDRLVAEVGELLQKSGDRLILDLAGLAFLNSTGLGTLVRVNAQANVQEQRVVLARPSAVVDGVLRTTQLIKFFETHDTLEQAAVAIR